MPHAAVENHSPRCTSAGRPPADTASRPATRRAAGDEEWGPGRGRWRTAGAGEPRSAGQFPEMGAGHVAGRRRSELWSLAASRGRRNGARPLVGQSLPRATSRWSILPGPQWGPATWPGGDHPGVRGRVVPLAAAMGARRAESAAEVVFLGEHDLAAMEARPGGRAEGLSYPNPLRPTTVTPRWGPGHVAGRRPAKPATCSLGRQARRAAMGARPRGRAETCKGSTLSPRRKRRNGGPATRPGGGERRTGLPPANRTRFMRLLAGLAIPRTPPAACTRWSYEDALYCTRQSTRRLRSVPPVWLSNVRYPPAPASMKQRSSQP